MAFETQHPPHGPSTSIILNGKVNETKLKYSAIEFVLSILQELQGNLYAKAPAQTSYSITFEEYCYLLDILPDLKDLRNIWGRNRYKIITLSQMIIYKLTLPTSQDRIPLLVTTAGNYAVGRY